MAQIAYKLLNLEVGHYNCQEHGSLSPTSTLFVEKLWTCRVSVFVSLPQVGGSPSYGALARCPWFHRGIRFWILRGICMDFADVPNPKTLKRLTEKAWKKQQRRSEHFRAPHFISFPVPESRVFFRFSAGAGTFISLAGDQDSERKQFWIFETMCPP